MKVIDIVKKVLNMTENFDTLFSLNAGDVLAPEEGLLINSYVNCLNLVRDEISTEIIPNVKEEKVVTKNGRIDFADLSSEVVEIISLINFLGNSVKFDVFSDHLMVDENQVTVKYIAKEKELSLEDEFYSTIPERVYAYGILREHAYIQALYEDASIWEERFKNSLQSLSRKKNETVVARRRWL